MLPGNRRVPFDAHLAVREVLGRIGDRWSVVVIMLLRGGPMRFSDLQRAISGISRRMLTRTLRALERDGLLARTVHPTIPPRVDYELTDLGRTLLASVQSLASWAEARRFEVEQARDRFDNEVRRRKAKASRKSADT